MDFDKIRGNFGLFLGLFVFILILLMPVPQTFIHYASNKLNTSDLTPEVLKVSYSMKVTLALLFLMIIWWITEAVPIPITALLPGIILPIFQTYGVQDGKLIELNGKNVFLNYANPVIFLFLAGFLIAGALQKWGIDRRIALWILTRGNIAKSPNKILFGLILASALVSMWVSNTATTAMMLPIGLGILSKLNVDLGSNFGKTIMFGIAYASSIGGVGTIVGTPPNGIAVSILANEKVARISFLDWMIFGVPFVIFALPVLWFVLKIVFKFDISISGEVKKSLISERNKLGNLTKAEKLTLFGFLFTVLLWVTNPFWRFIPFFGDKLRWFDEYLIAVFGSVLLFVLPVDLSKRKFVLDWGDSKYVEWGTLLLFGGGIALSDAMFKTGLATVISTEFVKLFGHPSPVLLVPIVVILVDFLTEVTSNTAVTSMMVPILISICSELNVNPLILVLPATVASSMAFMLPVATPPNAIVYGTRYVSLKDMLKVGFILDLVMWFYITVFFYVAGAIGLVNIRLG
ncbi:MAG: DASS family sodium-coupled anion symporter [Candidatus Kryptonium sp.]|nr:DASS family sodium-coupled anion symporter [Candidatus Kryptonium sp.]